MGLSYGVIVMVMLGYQIATVCATGLVPYVLADAQRTDVQYRLIRSENDTGILTNETTISSIDLNTSLPTKLLIHGWGSTEDSPWYSPLKNAYIQKESHNIFYIDWHLAGNKSYLVSSANTKPIGEFIGDFLIASKIDLNKIHVIGHSLGSHVASHIGKRLFSVTGTKVGRITGTDPASPIFESIIVPESERLNPEDAQFVDIIHTDIGHYGFTKALGHVDYYPNGGKDQPGCPSLEEDDNCSHAKSNAYLTKSVNTTDIKATLCDSWEDFTSEKCKDNTHIVFGENVDRSSRGVYYLEIS